MKRVKNKAVVPLFSQEAALRRKDLPLIFTQFQLKIIACVAMTIDHIPKLMFTISSVESIATLANIIGRVAAPLFLFCFVESLHKTHNKKRLLLRLYGVNIGISLLVCIINFLFHDWLGIHDFGQCILTTFLYIGLYSYLIESLIVSLRQKKHQNIIRNALLLVLFIILPIMVYNVIFNGGIIERIYDGYLEGTTNGNISLIGINSLCAALIPNPLYVEYTLLFVVMGICFYFSPIKKRPIIFCLFCLVSYVGLHLSTYVDLWPLTDFFVADQWKMILALPLMLLYSGERGRNAKWFFYLYYPLHRYALIGIAAIISAFN